MERPDGQESGNEPVHIATRPDRFHKYGRSGGSYGVIVPDAGAEGIFVAETAMPFVSYLNWVVLQRRLPLPRPLP